MFIYFFQFEYKKTSFSELIILIPSSAKQHLIEAKPLANIILSALMLHQSMEMSYRAAEIMIVGKDRTTHCIRNHQKYLSHYAHEFNLIFNEKKEEDMKLVDLLNDAYSAVRYKNTYQITADQLAPFIKKADTMNTMVAELYELVTDQFTQCLPRNQKSNPMKAPLAKDTTTENLMAALAAIEKIIKGIHH